MCIRDRRYAEHEADVRRMLAEAERSRQRLLELVDEDAEGFAPLSRAYALPKEDPSRAAIIEEGTKRACEAPLRMMEETCRVIAVSYTHLDVYKRQRRHRAAEHPEAEPPRVRGRPRGLSEPIEVDVRVEEPCFSHLSIPICARGILYGCYTCFYRRLPTRRNARRFTVEEMPKTYDPQSKEPELIQKWIDAGCYQRSKGVGDCTVVIQMCIRDSSIQASSAVSALGAPGS